MRTLDCREGAGQFSAVELLHKWDSLDTNATSCTTTEGNVKLIEEMEVRITGKPPLRTELEWLAKDIRVVQDMS